MKHFIILIIVILLTGCKWEEDVVKFVQNHSQKGIEYYNSELDKHNLISIEMINGSTPSIGQPFNVLGPKNIQMSSIDPVLLTLLPEISPNLKNPPISDIDYYLYKSTFKSSDNNLSLPSLNYNLNLQGKRKDSSLCVVKAKLKNVRGYSTSNIPEDIFAYARIKPLEGNFIITQGYNLAFSSKFICYKDINFKQDLKIKSPLELMDSTGSPEKLVNFVLNKKLENLDSISKEEITHYGFIPINNKEIAKPQIKLNDQILKFNNNDSSFQISYKIQQEEAFSKYLDYSITAANLDISDIEIDKNLKLIKFKLKRINFSQSPIMEMAFNIQMSYKIKEYTRTYPTYSSTFFIQNSEIEIPKLDRVEFSIKVDSLTNTTVFKKSQKYSDSKGSETILVSILPLTNIDGLDLSINHDGDEDLITYSIKPNTELLDILNSKGKTYQIPALLYITTKTYGKEVISKKQQNVYVSFTDTEEKTLKSDKLSQANK